MCVCVCVWLTDVSSENGFNLFLLKLSLDDQLICPINGTTAKHSYDTLHVSGGSI